MTDASYRLLISFFGECPSEILPVYHHFARTVPLHLLLHDDARRDRRQAARMLEGIHTWERHAATEIRTLSREIDAHDPDTADDLIEAVGRLAGGDFSAVLFNVTGAAGALAFELACRLRSRGASILHYDLFENLCEIASTRLHRFACRGCDIPTHLALKGYTLIEATPREDLANRKAEVLALGLQLERYKEFSDAYVRHGTAQTIHGYEDITTILERIGRLEDRHYIQGTLFEEYIYFLLEETGWFDDIRTGVRVRFDEEVENEFDILMIRENHLHTIECKLVKKLDGEHFVYKTDKTLEYLDYDGRAMILSVGAPNERRYAGGRVRRQFTRGDLARARHAEILIHQRHRFDPKEFLLEVYDWFVRAYET